MPLNINDITYLPLFGINVYKVLDMGLDKLLQCITNGCFFEQASKLRFSFNSSK
jgi:hypothetical protein